MDKPRRAGLSFARSATAGACALAGLLCAGAFADEPRAPVMPVMPVMPAPARALSVPAYGDADRACLEWTDSCRICARDAPGQPARCSTPGPVCQPAPIACTRR